MTDGTRIEFRVSLTDMDPKTVFGITDCLDQATDVVATMDNLGCAARISGGQCRANASDVLDPDNSNSIRVIVECPLSGQEHQQTCDGLTRFLISGYPGSLRSPGMFSATND